MPHTETAHTVVAVTKTLRELLKIMNFPEIPEEANHIAFFKDGEACFLEKLETPPGHFSFPRMMFVSTSVQTDVQVQIDD